MNAIDAPLAPAGGEIEKPPAALKLKGAGRLAPSAAEWATPLPPRLLQKLPPEVREQHETLVRRHRAAQVDARNLAVRLDAEKVKDQDAAERALLRDRKAPAPRAPEL